MAQTIVLGTRADERQRQLGGFEAVSSLLKDFRDKETARQDKQQLLDFVKLTQSGMSTEEAAAQVTASQPEFDPGLGGIFQRFGAGGADPRSVLNIALKSQLDKPSDLEVREREARIGASEALTASRKGTGQIGRTKAQKQRDSDAKIIANEKSEPQQIAEARNRMAALPKEALFDAADADLADGEFTDIFKGLKKLKVKVPGARFDKFFGEDAFAAALEEAKKRGLDEGIDPDTMEDALTQWWDEQAAKSDFKQKGFGKEFQPRSEFKVAVDADIFQKALTDGKINQEELESAKRIIAANPEREDEIRKALGL